MIGNELTQNLFFHKKSWMQTITVEHCVAIVTDSNIKHQVDGSRDEKLGHAVMMLTAKIHHFKLSKTPCKSAMCTMALRQHSHTLGVLSNFFICDNKLV